MKATARLWTSLFLVCGPLLAAQTPVTPPPDDDRRSPLRPASRAGEYHVIVEGCVQGTRLEPLLGLTNLAWEYLNASTWRLEGTREMVQRIRNDYDRHHVEVTGIATLPQMLQPRDEEIESFRLPDGTRVTVGGRRTSTRAASPPVPEGAPVRLRVESITVLNERCG